MDHQIGVGLSHAATTVSIRWWPQSIMKKSLVTTSKFLSLVLRHKPEAIGMQLDADGWLDINALIENANEHGNAITARTPARGGCQERQTTLRAKRRWASHSRKSGTFDPGNKFESFSGDSPRQTLSLHRCTIPSIHPRAGALETLAKSRPSVFGPGNRCNCWYASW